MKHSGLAVLVAFLGGPLLAQAGPSEEIIEALTSRGYRIILQERTWLGRERVIAETTTKRRELVFNPETGEIMRDYITAFDEHEDEGDRSAGVTTAAPPATVTATETLTPKSIGTGDETAVIEDPVAPVVSPGN